MKKAPRPPPVNTAVKTRSRIVSSAPGMSTDDNNTPVLGKSVTEPVRDDEGKKTDTEVKSKVSEPNQGTFPGGESEKSNPEASIGSDGRVTPVGKLAPDAFKPFGQCSRSSSDTSSVASFSICRGGPGKPKCGGPVEDDDLAVGCDLCEGWFHIGCQSISVEAYETLKSYPMLAWICPECKQALEQKNKTKRCPTCLRPEREKWGTEMRDHMVRVESALKEQADLVSKQTKLVEVSLQRQQELASKQSKLEESFTQVARQQGSYSDAVKGTCEELMAKVSSKIDTMPKPATPKPVLPSSAQEISGIFNDFMDKDRRKLNLVVHNLPESDGANQMEADAGKFVSIVKEELKLIVKTTKAFRVGKPSGEKPRLLIVTLENMETKLEVLKMASQLRRSTEWSNIYITKDLTWKEREVQRKLRAELARRRENGEDDIVIKGLQIVKRESRAAAPAAGAPEAPVATSQSAGVAAPSSAEMSRVKQSGGATVQAGQQRGDVSAANASGSTGSGPIMDRSDGRAAPVTLQAGEPSEEATGGNDNGGTSTSH